ncbi:MAG: hypothetical protein HQL32_11265 [Planctomycetes bacterium]|nr:hypothetical protein [Planctomycetota bacterium]
MKDKLHNFHIPVMGTGYSIDSPIRVAPFGIASVISLVDDLLCEQIREHYCAKYNLPYEKIPRRAEDGRALRITAYLDMVHDIVELILGKIKAMPFGEDNDKKKYFDLLPENHPLKEKYNSLLEKPSGAERSQEEEELSAQMKAGSIDVNIMVKLDRINYKGKEALPDEYRDARAALRGYANSKLDSAIIYSAGINQPLFGYMAEFKDFYRDEAGKIKKRIILKVSDFRSALIQGKFMAKKGLEVFEFRVESGLNCGGHAFPSNGQLLPTVLQEFKEKREQLRTTFLPPILKYYEQMGREYPAEATQEQPQLTVQGGIGNYGENCRMFQGFGFDGVGWATPFLLVREASCVDQSTRDLLKVSGEEELYLSGASPLQISFNNIKGSGSDMWTRNEAKSGAPGSACPKGFLVTNTEFTDLPICIASKKYQKKKLHQIEESELSAEAKKGQIDAVLEKACICDHLGNSALIELQIVEGEPAQAICPGPNIKWFDREYSLKEMVDHLYGRSESLVASERPHMFAKELLMYMKYCKEKVDVCSGPREIKTVKEMFKNLKAGMDLIKEIAQGSAFFDENLDSLTKCVEEQENVLTKLEEKFLEAQS